MILLIWSCFSCITGCGLTDYENKMRETQDRLNRFEEIQQLLGDPLEMPTRPSEKEKEKEKEKAKMVPLIKLFLRAPREIRTSPELKTRHPSLYRYPTVSGGSGGSSDSSSPSGSNVLVRTVEIGIGESPKDYAQSIFSLFGRAEGPPKAKEVTTASGDELTFDHQEIEDENHRYLIYVLRERPIAIAFWLDKKKIQNSMTVFRSVELSLESLALDNKADWVRGRFRRNSPWQGLSSQAVKGE